MGPAGLEPATKTPVKAGFSKPRDSKSDPIGATADLVRGILSLPLTDSEKAEALRRLLAEGDG